LAAGLILALPGCNVNADVSENPEQGGSTTVGQGAPVPGTEGQAHPTSDWTPDVPLDNEIQMSQAEKLQARAEELRTQAQTAGIEDPPEVELVRWIKPEEFAPTNVRCLNEAGFDVGITDDGTGIDSRTIPGAQTEALELAIYTCTAQYSIDPRYAHPLNDAQLGIMYDYLVESYVPCIEALGYPLAEPPSKQVYVGSPAMDRWMPILELRRLPQSQFSRVVMNCPETPASDVLYGS